MVDGVKSAISGQSIITASPMLGVVFPSILDGNYLQKKLGYFKNSVIFENNIFENNNFINYVRQQTTMVY